MFYRLKRISICPWVIFLFTLAGVQVTAADQVTPSARVKTSLTVRQQPDAQSDQIGALLPGDKAPLVEALPYWFRVQLPDGTFGYVSKAWAKKITEQNSGVIRLGSWNIKKLGHGTSTDFPAVAGIIEDDFDIVAIIEVMQKGGMHPGYDALLSALGPQWAGLVTDSPRPRIGSGSSEFYAILYRPELVRPCQGWGDLVILKDNDGSESGTGPDLFSREPAFGCFEAPTSGGPVGFDFLFAVYHARWEKGKVSRIKEEVGHLKDLFQTMSIARPGERDLLIAGDFNLVPAQIEETLGLEVTTQGTGSTLNKDGSRTSNLYDNLLLSDPVSTSELTDGPRILDVTGSVDTGKKFYQTVSDHLPLQATFNVSGPDDD